MTLARALTGVAVYRQTSCPISGCSLHDNKLTLPSLSSITFFQYIRFVFIYYRVVYVCVCECECARASCFSLSLLYSTPILSVSFHSRNVLFDDFIWLLYKPFMCVCVCVCVLLLFPCCTDSFESSTGIRSCFLRAEYKQITFSIFQFISSVPSCNMLFVALRHNSYSTRCSNGT
jgi:hypothetical protein